MSRAYDFRQKKAINYNEKVSNRTKSNPSSARKTRGRKSESSSIASNSSRLRRQKTANCTYEEDEDDSPESSQAPVLEQPEPIMLRSNLSSARKTRGRKSNGSSNLSNSRNLRRKKAVNHTYEEDGDDPSESSQAPIRGQPEPIMLDSPGNSSPDPNLTDAHPVFDDLPPPILTRECNNYSEVYVELSNRAKSTPSSSRKTRGRKSKGSSTISNSSRLRRKKTVNYSYKEDEDDAPGSAQAPILGQTEPVMLGSTRNMSPDPNLTALFPVLDDLSPPILTREVNNNSEEKDIASRGSSPPPELEPMEQMASEQLPISDDSGPYPVLEVRPIVTLDELLEQRARSAEKVLTGATPSPNSSPIMLEPTENPPNSRECEICGNQASKVHYDLHTCESCSVEFFSSFFDDPRNSYHVEDLTSPNLSPIMSEPSENPANSIQCQVCGDQANGVHLGVETCESCSLFFEQKVAELPDYNCYCNRVWKHSFDINVSCHCCRFQKCLDVGMQIPPDSMFSRITPHSGNLGLCRVCRDIGTSHCKGVVTCRSCMFFLFRSTQTPFDGECDKICLISPSTRDCPACRFKEFREAESQIPKNDQEDLEQLRPSPSV